MGCQEVSAHAQILLLSAGPGSCGGLLQALWGSIQSPGYPNSYPNNARCVWRIRLRDPASRVELQFLDVQLEGGSCSYDAIEVFDGGSPGGRLLGTVCTNDSRVFTSSGHQLTILFRSDYSITGRGFQAYYSSFLAFSSTTAPGNSGWVTAGTSTSGPGSCGGLLQALWGSIQSPGYPNSYPNNARCVWRIRLRDPASRVELQFLDVQLEGGSCSYDAIEVFDGGSPGGRLLGPGSCGGLLQALWGSIQSPGYPNSYPNDARCVWRIRLRDPASRVELQFLDVQ
ncbi:deleted in malignant brain tumors 1 protein-like [Empidonax traillii]|uniref:deleted in malignant brain tumors 1 protein-like n=1 Tax=Empidonax traillii TaxID=164674 RepID=UPI000FFD1CDB|nr:deleted in malignant brain tumors 1 protein-like [Empidonax traillii]